MSEEFINLTNENLASEHISCIIRSKSTHPGIEAKKRWLSQRLPEGHVFRKRNVKSTVFIEYAPLETAWVPILGENYLYLYCLWVAPEQKGNGYGKVLMDYAIQDAKKQGKSGICMLGAEKQKAWLSDQAFAKRYGFERIDQTAYGYELLALSFDGTYPHFTKQAKQGTIASDDLTIYYDMQCPYIYQTIEKIKQYCEEHAISSNFILVDTLDQAKQLPCAFNNFAVFYKGKFETVNLLSVDNIKRLLARG